MSLADYEDFYYGACLADDADPLSAWKRASEETERLAEWIEGHEEVRVDARRGPTSSSASPAASSSPATASTTCPTASSSPARSRTRSRARSASTCRR